MAVMHQIVSQLPIKLKKKKTTMAAADSGLTHLQSAMKMAKEAIQLEGGNRHKLSCHTSNVLSSTSALDPSASTCLPSTISEDADSPLPLLPPVCLKKLGKKNNRKD
ncbi:hypothetical protein ATANTOWER_030469 [Ataeniobius toweri]|uniref:Uncharacterized protein n=1 Tax=Ataeniobius toweri TaxID=208326 RepID=A0ABU7BL64_9TELE|nr:hypothetical protein [Ataeniobius toweri]